MEVPPVAILGDFLPQEFTPSDAPRCSEAKSAVAGILGVIDEDSWDILDSEKTSDGTLYLTNIIIPLFSPDDFQDFTPMVLEHHVDTAMKVRGAVVNLETKQILVGPRYYFPMPTNEPVDGEVLEGIDGTMIRIFQFSGEFFFSTNNRLHAEKYRWDSEKTFGQIFTEHFGDWKNPEMVGTYVVSRDSCIRADSQPPASKEEQEKILSSGGFLVLKDEHGLYKKLVGDRYIEKVGVRGNDPNYVRRFYRLSVLSLPKNNLAFRKFMGSEFRETEIEETKTRLTMIASRFSWATGTGFDYMASLTRDRNAVVNHIMSFYGQRRYKAYHRVSQILSEAVSRSSSREPTGRKRDMVQREVFVLVCHENDFYKLLLNTVVLGSWE